MRTSITGDLHPSHILELQRILTEGTLDNPDAAGRLQRVDEERIAVLDRTDGGVLLRPPPAAELPERLQRLCDFANEELHPATEFIHPTIRAILLHFWLAYDHPFEDGNGRTARALFYWSMRRSGYWLVEFLSISRILGEAPAQYSESFLLTETDELDTTYFLLFQLRVIERAVHELQQYLARKVAQVRQVERLIRGAPDFNHRQLVLLGDALRGSDRTYTYGGHAASHAVTHETARSDLSALADRGLLVKHQRGRAYTFTVPDDLAERLALLNGDAS